MVRQLCCLMLTLAVDKHALQMHASLTVHETAAHPAEAPATSQGRSATYFS